MPNQPDKHKRILAIQMRRELYAQLKKLAQRHNLSLSAVCRNILAEAAKEVELNPEDLQQIQDDIAKLYRSPNSSTTDVRHH